jgi:hypothetical protein
MVFEWCQANIPSNRTYRFVILDVHSGLGPYGIDTLITIDPPTEKMIAHFSEKINLTKQTVTVGYRPKGVFMHKLSSLLQNYSEDESIVAIGQEFGTFDEPTVLSTLYYENIAFQLAKRTGEFYDPNGPEGMALLNVFCPDDPNWKDQTIRLGHDLLVKAIAFLNDRS